ncbi:MAG TPA: SsrA-binding protein SmpB [Acidimicrobiia bacterium]|nr:SsrA-binding protein SmpB [Acidimicrobiia bacterium]
MSEIQVVATNRRARHDYEIIDDFEAGIVLTGSEVKSLRAGKADLKDSFAHVRDGEVWLVNAYIAPYSFAREGGHDPERSRKLLLHRREIDRIAGSLAEKGLTLVPMRLYFKDGKAKVQVGLGRGKRTIDKRADLKRREHEREMERARRRRHR